MFLMLVFFWILISRWLLFVRLVNTPVFLVSTEMRRSSNQRAKLKTRATVVAKINEECFISASLNLYNGAEFRGIPFYKICN
uniref:Putative secreted protein n=1 Tax=Ixodes ricinus TaxID=34613 RepID=A0A6B0U7I7_IXORI